MGIFQDDARRFLSAQMPHLNNMTVAAYLDRLALSIWTGEGSEKHGWTDSSDWRDDLYTALIEAGLAYGPLDEWNRLRQRSADTLIDTVIRHRHELERP